MNDFLKTHWPSIMSVVITFITLMIVFQILGVNFNPVEDKHIEKVVTIESFDTDASQDIIKKNISGDLHKQEETCRGFSTRACRNSSFCVLLDGDRCHSGNRTGLTFHTDDEGKEIKYNYFWFHNKCKSRAGELCPKE